jgi:hypothetical protein
LDSITLKALTNKADSLLGNRIKGKRQQQQMMAIKMVQKREKATTDGGESYVGKSIKFGERRKETIGVGAEIREKENTILAYIKSQSTFKRSTSLTRSASFLTKLDSKRMSSSKMMLDESCRSTI